MLAARLGRETSGAWLNQSSEAAGFGKARLPWQKSKEHTQVEGEIV